MSNANVKATPSPSSTKVPPPIEQNISEVSTSASQHSKGVVWGKVLLGAVIGLPVGLLAGLKYAPFVGCYIRLSPDFFYRCEANYPKAIGFLRRRLPLNWPEPASSTEVNSTEVEEEDGPITVVIKEDELEEPLRDFLRSIEETNTIDGVALERIVNVLVAARTMLLEEKQRLAADVCPLPVIEEKEEEESSKGEGIFVDSVSGEVVESKESIEEESEWHLSSPQEVKEGEWGFVTLLKDVKEELEELKEVRTEIREIRNEEVKELVTEVPWKEYEEKLHDRIMNVINKIHIMEENEKERVIMKRAVKVLEEGKQMMEKERSEEMKRSEQMESESESNSEQAEQAEQAEMRMESESEVISESESEVTSESEVIPESESEVTSELDPEPKLLNPEPESVTEQEPKPESTLESIPETTSESEPIHQSQPQLTDFTDWKRAEAVLQEARTALVTPSILSQVESTVREQVTSLTSQLHSSLQTAMDSDIQSTIEELEKQLRDASVEESRRLYVLLKEQRNEMEKEFETKLVGLEDSLREILLEKLQSEEQTQVIEILNTYKARVTEIQKEYIDHLDDLVYAEEMWEKAKCLQEEESMSESLHQDMEKKIQDMKAIVEEEKEEKQKTLMILQKRMNDLIGRIDRSIRIFETSLVHQECQRAFIHLQYKSLQGGDITEEIGLLTSKANEDPIMAYLLKKIPQSIRVSGVPSPVTYLTEFESLRNDARAASKTAEDASFGGQLLGRAVVSMVGTQGIDPTDPLVQIEKINECLTK